jgi:cystathionine gamma-synthase
VRTTDHAPPEEFKVSKPRDPRTIAASNGVGADRAFKAIIPPLYLTSTFGFDGYGRNRGHEYTRTSNPTRHLLAETLAKLEGGSGAIVTSSGMAAVDLVLSQLGQSDLVIAPHDCYSGTYRLLLSRKERKQFDVAFVDQGDEGALAAALHRQPKLVLVETPSNPLLRVVDIRKIAKRAKAIGAKVAVDNTFLSPALQRPIALGADFVIHSTTKYLNGHSDVVGGAVVAAVAADADELSNWANIIGVTGAPFDAHLTLRGIRTLYPRIECQQSNALAIAQFLASHPLVIAVHYPGLVSDPGHSIASAQQSGFGAMLSFEMRSGPDGVRQFLEAVEIFTLAESLGGVESLVAHPATMTHAGMGSEVRRVAGIGDNLIRLSIGLEAEADLVADLERGLDAVSGTSER